MYDCLRAGVVVCVWLSGTCCRMSISPVRRCHLTCLCWACRRSSGPSATGRGEMSAGRIPVSALPAFPSVSGGRACSPSRRTVVSAVLGVLPLPAPCVDAVAGEEGCALGVFEVGAHPGWSALGVVGADGLLSPVSAHDPLVGVATSCLLVGVLGGDVSHGS